MTHRAVRVVFALVFVTALAYAGYELWRTEGAINEARRHSRSFDDASRALVASIGELRSAQQAYVAAGQGEDFWIRKVDTIRDLVNDEEEQLSALTQTPESVAAVAELRKTLDAFREMNRRAAEYTRGGQRLLASDLIFTDGLEVVAAATAQLELARAAERSESDRLESEARKREGYYLAGVAGIGLLVVLTLVPLTQVTQPVVWESASAPDALGSLPLHVSDQSIESDRATANESPPAAPPVPEAVMVSNYAGDTADGVVADIQAMAALCTEFSRVIDARELTPLLERACRLMGGSGAIVWVAEPDGRELRPVLAHGYSPQALLRIGAISRDDGHATAAAYRNAALEVVPAAGGRSGAIVTPLLSPSGCIGVMSAEIADGKESDVSCQALAAIIAAQLSVLLTVSAETSKAVPMEANA